MNTIPQNHTWTQNSSGDIFGMLHATRNINFDKKGYAQLAKRPVALFYNVSNFGTVTSIQNLGSTYYAMTGGRPFSFVLDGSAPTDMTGSGHTGSIQFDGLTWQGRWYITQSTTFAYYDGASWTTGLGSLNAVVAGMTGHVLEVFQSLNYLAVGDRNQVKLYDTSHSLQATLTIPSNFEVRWIRYNNANVYIGTKNLNGGQAMMFVWNGTGSAAQAAWPVQADWMFSGLIYKSSITIMTSIGQLLRFTGAGWEELGNLPVYYSTYSWYQGVGYNNGRMEQRGMTTDGNLIYMNVDGYIGDPNVYLDNQPSGLWIYDPSVGLYHRAGWSTSAVNTITVSSVNTTTDTFTTAGSITAESGVRVFYKASSASGGLVSKKYYYLIAKTATTFQLASSYANAIAGTAIDITSSGTSESVIFCNETEFGSIAETSVQPGAVSLISSSDSNPLTFGYMTGSQVLYGAGAIGTGTINTLQSLSPALNTGYFVTQKITSSSVLDIWHQIGIKFARLFQTSDKIIVKYKTFDKAYYPITSFNGSLGLTWQGRTTFTTTTDLSTVATGEEVEILSDSGAGCLRHIKSATNNSGTWTVILDEPIPNTTAGNTGSFKIDNWIKFASYDKTKATNFILNTFLVKEYPWIRLKIEFRGHSEPYVEEVKVFNNPSV